VPDSHRLRDREATIWTVRRDATTPPVA
jgi:hypothetical protein